MRSAAARRLRDALSTLHATSRACASAAAPQAAESAPLARFRQRLASGPAFDDFVSGASLAPDSVDKEGYSVAAPPLKARRRAQAGVAPLGAHAPPPTRRASLSRSG